MLAQDPLSVATVAELLQQTGYQEILQGAREHVQSRLCLDVSCNGHDSDTPDQVNCIPIQKVGTRRRVKRNDIIPSLHGDGFIAGVL